jgi:hypothetical protein
MESDLEFPPVAIGDWYQTTGGDLLEIVAADDADGSIEVQYFDGTLAEFDTESWLDTISGPAAEPEDWSGSLDVSREDYGTDESESDGYANARRYIDGA